MISAHRIVAATLILGALAARAPAAPAPPDDAGLIAAVDAIAAEHLARPGGVGLSIGVARGGVVVLERGYGLADAELDVPADAQTMFRIGSVTKQFTAAEIMRLVERGRLSLDDGLGSLLPDFPTHGHTVTLRHLLNHTSGIKSYTSMGEAWRKLWPLELSHEELLTLVRDEPFDFAPGEKWAYNNTAYYMLGMIIEMDAGVSYAEHMHSQIFAPLRLLRTRYDSNRDLIRNRAQGYAFEGGTLTNDEPLGMSQPGGAGGLLSTGGDLVRWSMALTAGQVVSADSFALMSTPTILPDGTSTGYGFGLAVDEFEGRRRISHGGGIMGFNSMLLFLPEGNVHVGVISNGETVRSDKIAEAIARAALGIEKATVHDEPLAPELMARIAGGYRFEERPMDVRVWDDGGRAMVQASGPGQGAFRILYQGAAAAEDGGEVFRAEFDTDVRLVFAADGASFVLHQGGRRLTARRAGG